MIIRTKLQPQKFHKIITLVSNVFLLNAKEVCLTILLINIKILTEIFSLALLTSQTLKCFGPTDRDEERA